jgi:hypothetical protein
MSFTNRDPIGKNEKSAGSRRPGKSGAAAMLLAGAFAMAGVSGCGDEPEAEPTVVIESPANGATVAGPNILVKVRTTHFQFTAGGAGKRSAAQHGDEDAAGHVHIFLDRPAGLDSDAIKTMTKDTATIQVSTPGTHYLIVQGADAGHADFESMTDSVKFTVAIP